MRCYSLANIKCWLNLERTIEGSVENDLKNEGDNEIIWKNCNCPEISLQSDSKLWEMIIWQYCAHNINILVLMVTAITY